MKKQIIPSKKIQTNERNRFKLICPFVLFYLFASAFYPSASAFSQSVGINTTGAIPNSSAGLDVNFTNKGLLIPRVTLQSTTDVTTISSPANSLLVYNTNVAMTGGTTGYWYYNALIPAWVQLAATAAGGNDWTIIGNAGTVDVTNFIGTTDNVPFNIRVNNQKAGRIDVSTVGNSFYGYQAGNFNAGGTGNTATGQQALYSNTTGNDNTAIGLNALLSNTTGFENTATGENALRSNISGNRNTACGYYALYFNTGTDNTAIGNLAMNNNQAGYNNTASGTTALFLNSGGYANTANGSGALYFNTSGFRNTASGYGAGSAITTGSNNTAIGYNAQVPTATASNQVRIGDENISYAGVQVAWSITCNFSISVGKRKEILTMRY